MYIHLSLDDGIGYFLFLLLLSLYDFVY